MGEKAVIGGRVLVGAKSQLFAGSLGREGKDRKARVGGSLITALRWLAWARRLLSGDVCWWQRNHSYLVARLGEKAEIGRRVLVRAKSKSYLGDGVHKPNGDMAHDDVSDTLLQPSHVRERVK